MQNPNDYSNKIENFPKFFKKFTSEIGIFSDSNDDSTLLF